MSPTIKPRQLLARLRTLAKPVDPVPAGARTVRGWAKEWSMSFRSALDYLAVGLRSGEVRRVYLRVRNAGGAVRRVPYYLPAKGRS